MASPERQRQLRDLHGEVMLVIARSALNGIPLSVALAALAGALFALVNSIEEAVTRGETREGARETHAAHDELLELITGALQEERERRARGEAKADTLAMDRFSSRIH